MSFTLFKIGGSRKKTLSTIVRFPYSLRTSSYYYANYYASLPRNHSIIDSLPLLARYGNVVGRYGNEIESTLNADCLRRKETLNSVAGANISNDRKP